MRLINVTFQGKQQYLWINPTNPIPETLKPDDIIQVNYYQFKVISINNEINMIEAEYLFPNVTPLNLDKLVKQNVEILTGEVISKPKGIKDSEDKLNYELDWDFIKAMAERMALNKDKYPAYNWKQPIDIESLKQSLFRHVIEIMSGNYEDNGEDLGHLSAVALNAMFLFNQMQIKEESIIVPKVTGLHRIPEPTHIKYGPTPGVNPPIGLSPFMQCNNTGTSLEFVTTTTCREYPENTTTVFNTPYVAPITKS